MPCPSNHIAFSRNVEVTDLLFLHAFTANARYEPRNRAELVAAVAASTRSGHSIRALGSNWSLSEAGVAEDVLDTSALRMFLGQPCPAPSVPLVSSRIRGSGSDLLARSCARDPRMLGRNFVHVEAGIKIRELLADLGACGLALPTMGDGAGQSLIGAISTATHGGDLQVPPLSEWIRAVHLVGPHGQEWWITPPDSPFGNITLVSMLPDWCEDTRFLADNDAFDAVRVGVGRMGVIYSVIFEVLPTYSLIEVNMEHRWRDTRAELTVSRISSGRASGVFDLPLTDLDSGWFRTEVLKRTIFRTPYTDPGTTTEGFVFEAGAPKWADVPAYFGVYPDVYYQLLADMGLTGLAADLRGVSAMPLHHINLAISLSTPGRCWMRRRWVFPSAVREVALRPRTEDPVVAAVKANKTTPPGISGVLKQRLQLHPILNFLGWLSHDSRKQRLDWYLDSEIDRILEEHAANGATSGEALFFILHRIATDPVLGAAESVATIASEVISQAFGKLIRAGPASGALNANMLDAHDYDVDGAQSADSAEFHFDAASGVYLEFVDRVIAFAREHFPVFGYIGIRFTPVASALIAMQQFNLTVSIEVSTPRTRLQDFYAEFWNEVHAAARALGALPHWGQTFRHSSEELATLYGDRLEKWRGVLAYLAAHGPGVFSTGFSRSKGLEPLGRSPLLDEENDAIEQFLLGLEGGVDRMPAE